jgi:hypothetical protein
MKPSESFREGIKYLLQFKGFGAQNQLARCSGFSTGHFSKMLTGKVQINEKYWELIANCMSVTAQELITLGDAIRDGYDNDPMVEVVLQKSLLMPDKIENPDSVLEAVNPEDLSSYPIGEAWTLEKKNCSFLVRFNRLPCVESLIKIRPKPKK